jgi:hypothetical protein
LASTNAFLALAHEGVHALDYARNGSASGHGEVFAALARELGLSAEKRTTSPRLGDYDPALTDRFCAECGREVIHLCETAPPAGSAL